MNNTLKVSVKVDWIGLDSVGLVGCVELKLGLNDRNESNGMSSGSPSPGFGLQGLPSGYPNPFK